MKDKEIKKLLFKKLEEHASEAASIINILRTDFNIKEIYPRSGSQMAQVDCRVTLCLYYDQDRAGWCKNISPCFQIDGEQGYCVSKELMIVKSEENSNNI